VRERLWWSSAAHLSKTTTLCPSSCGALRGAGAGVAVPRALQQPVEGIALGPAQPGLLGWAGLERGQGGGERRGRRGRRGGLRPAQAPRGSAPALRQKALVRCTQPAAARGAAGRPPCLPCPPLPSEERWGA